MERSQWKRGRIVWFTYLRSCQVWPLGILYRKCFQDWGPDRKERGWTTSGVERKNRKKERWVYCKVRWSLQGRKTREDKTLRAVCYRAGDVPGEITMLDRKESEDGPPVFVFFMIVILMHLVLGCLFIHFLAICTSFQNSVFTLFILTAQGFKFILITCLKHNWQEFPPIFRLSLLFPPSETSCLFLLLGVRYIFLNFFSFKIHIKVINSF